MVAAKIHTNPSTRQNPFRPPLPPSEKTYNADSISRKPLTKSINSRYLHSSSSSSSSSSSFTHHSQITTTRSLSVSFQGESFSFQTTKPKPILQNSQKSPTTKTQKLNCPLEKKGHVLSAVRVVGHSVVFDDKVKRANFDGDDLYLTSDTESLSPDSSVKGRVASRGICVPARFSPENFSPVKKSALMDTQLLPSPSRVLGSSVKRMDGHLSARVGNAPSVLCFRVKKGVSRIEEAHTYRLLYNRYLQWRFVNAHAETKISAQRMNVKKNMYDAWITISELRDSVSNERIKLQLLLQNLKLTSILGRQITLIEEWPLIDKEHYNYLSGVIEALKASTFRLPVVSGARENIHDLQNAIGSAVDVMQAMGTSICSLVPRVERMRVLMSELAKAAAHEQALLDQSKDLLSIVTALHVKQCSLQGHVIQLNRDQDIGHTSMLCQTNRKISYP